MLPHISYLVAGVWRRLCLGLTLALLLGACSPTYDWREVAAADGAIQLTFPGKPRSETRSLPLGAGNLAFTLTTVAAGGATFAVGHTQLPSASASASASGDGDGDGDGAEPVDPQVFNSVGEALIGNLTRHYPPEAVTRTSVMLRPVHAQRGVGLEAEEIRAENLTDPAAPRLLARVFRRDDRWIQVVVLGDPEKLSWETARWFVDSVRLP